MKLINTFITCHMLFKWGSSLATKSNTTLPTLSVRSSFPLQTKCLATNTELGCPVKRVQDLGGTSPSSFPLQTKATK